VLINLVSVNSRVSKSEVLETIDRIITWLEPQKKIIHHKDVKLWNIILQSRKHLNFPVSWDKLFDDFQILYRWYNSHSTDASFGLAIPITVRLICDASHLVTTLHQNKGLLKIPFNKGENKYFHYLSKLVDKMKLEFSDAFDHYLQILMILLIIVSIHKSAISKSIREPNTIYASNHYFFFKNYFTVRWQI